MQPFKYKIVNTLKYIAFVLVLFISTSISAQIKLTRGNAPKIDKNDPLNINDSLSGNQKKSNKKNKVAPIDMYLLYNHATQDTTYVDTTLTIKKYYKYNYLRKDNFGLLPFANIGQTYNSLLYNNANKSTNPIFGARARHFNYIEKEDINYYEMPTPWTQLFYKTAFQQGQVLDASFATNISKQFNFSIAYKGLRSLGNYQHALTSTGNFRVTTNYKTKNQRYKFKGHIVMQDLLNQENGGLKDEDVTNFTSGNEDFLDREVFDPNFENAENILLGKRFYLDQSYQLIAKKDSLSKNILTLNHYIQFEDKYYQYTQNSATQTYFGNSFTNSVKDRTTLENFQTGAGISYANNILGNLAFNVNYHNINYGYNRIVQLQNQTIPNRIKNNYLSLNAAYNKAFKKFSLSSSAALNLSQDFSGNYIKATMQTNLIKNIDLSATLNINSVLPNYNYLLNQSQYINYNWYNFGNFKNINTQELRLKLQSKKWLNAQVNISNIDNYTFFNLENTTNNIKVIKPKQHQETIQYLSVKLQKEFRLGNFALDNTIMYQNVTANQDVLNVPSIVTRNTLYYSNQLFKKAMNLQTGVTFNYFTKYNANGYDPLLAEFYNQNTTQIGAFPRLDFFVNAKIRQTRIYFIAEHFNASFTGYNYFSAPNHPYRDFTIRFGLVWDFFL